MRTVIVGSGSFIARAFARALDARGHAPLALRHDAVLDGILAAGDCVINFALAPGYRSGAYAEDQDCDLKAARAAAKAGAHLVMLSTRRVYDAGHRWNAVEDAGADGDGTAYGDNKARSERAVLEATHGRCGIFRLANIFGYEYGEGRRTFLGILLADLKRKNTVFFDMHPDTRRDFLPVEIAADLLAARALDQTAGIFNLGSGIGTRCGDLADWIRAGFGGGDLVCDPPLVQDEFLLNMNRWRGQFDLPVDGPLLQSYCVELGRRLNCEKSS